MINKSCMMAAYKQVSLVSIYYLNNIKGHNSVHIATRFMPLVQQQGIVIKSKFFIF